VKTLILAGGLGTRLREKVSDLPKAMAPVCGKPFLEWQLMQLKAQGFTDIILCVGYMADKITDYFGKGEKIGLNIEYSVEDKLLGTAGAVKNASRFIDDTFLLLNGDTFFDIDYQALVEFHEAKEAFLTLSLVMLDDVARYGSVHIDTVNRIKGFKEKQSDKIEFGYINAGVYAVEPTVLNCIAPKQAVSLENDVIPDTVKTGRVFGYVSEGAFIDIGTPESYEFAQKYFIRFT
jgi:D-glycero-alpha-D-manno-heptose 1-phosphate guanylyltransferase